MPAYVIMRIRPTNPTALNELRQEYAALLRKQGGRRLAGGPVWEVLEGSGNQRVFAVWQFPSVEVARALWQSPQYAEMKKKMKAAAEFDAWMLPDAAEPA